MPNKNGLHYLDIKENKEGIALVMMIRKNFEGYTKKQVESVIEAYCLQAMLAHPSRKDFEGMIHANLILNCPVTLENIYDAHFVNIWQDLGGKQSEKTRASGNELCPNTKRFNTNEQVCDTYS